LNVKVKGQSHQGQKFDVLSHHVIQQQTGPFSCRRGLISAGCVLFMFGKTALDLVMAALRSRCRHYFVALGRPLGQYFRPVVSIFLLSFFFPRLISAVADWMSTILPPMMWP